MKKEKEDNHNKYYIKKSRVPMFIFIFIICNMFLNNIDTIFQSNCFLLNALEHIEAGFLLTIWSKKICDIIQYIFTLRTLWTYMYNK